MRRAPTIPRTYALTAICAAILLGLPGRGGAFFTGSKKGTSGAAFLKIGPGARPAAMGEAFSAAGDDIHALYYNPAGLTGVRTWEFSGMHNSYFQDMSYNFIGVAVPMSRLLSGEAPSEPVEQAPAERPIVNPVFGELADAGPAERVAPSAGSPPAWRRGVLGLGVYGFSAGELDRRGTTDADHPLGTFGANDLAVALSYGLPLDDRVSLGGSLKFIRQSIDDKTASAFALDMGTLYRLDRRLTLAGGLRHLGSSPKFVSKSDPLPLVWYLGSRYRLRPRWTAAMDLALPRDRAVSFSLGTEYTRDLSENVRGALRGGFFSRNTDAEGLGGVSAGFGLGYGSADFDFAWVPFGDLGSTFRYSFTVKF